MIFDGYTLTASFDNRTFSYRPALAAERNQVTEMLCAYRVTYAAEDLARSAIRRHLVWESSPFEEWSDAEQDALFLIVMGKMKPQKGTPHTQADVQNLYDGVLLELTKPQFTKRTCEGCKAWWYDDDTGKVSTKNGKPLKRPEGTVLLCQTVEGCPVGTPENPKRLSAKNRRAWNHYQECKAVGQFPDDPIVRRNAMVIEKAIRTAQRRAKQ